MTARGFVNLPQVLGQASLMICHGGNGTLYHGLKRGVFMLCLTSHFEQEWNVQAIERIGYGVSANLFNENEWEEAINRALKKGISPFI